MEEDGHECRPVYDGEMVLCRSKDGEPWDGRDRTIMFQDAVSLGFQHFKNKLDNICDQIVRSL